TTWDHLHLEGRVTTRGIVETALTEVPLLRAAGADLVIALAHTGLGSAVAPSEHADPGHENAALALARVPGIDAILAGHSHHVFPDIASPRPGAPGVDHRAGTLAGVPAIMAGFRGSHLGVLDLCLAPPRDGAGWTVRASYSRARPVQPDAAAAPTPPDPQIERLARPAHRAALRLTARPIGHTSRPLRSYFARILPCDADAPILAAKMWALRNALAGTPHADLPILATTTCFRAGGHAGPDAFVDIPAGPLTLGHVAELYPFPNTLVGLRMTGAQVADWLERAASCFRQLRTGLGNRPQPLWDPAFAGHAFDTVAGLSYRIDLSRPARYDAEGRLVNPDARRIHDLRHGEHPLDPGAVFGVAVNNFRAFGGGPYPGAHPDSILHDARKPVRDHLVAFLRDTGDFDAATLRGRWHLDGPRDAVLSIKTGPGAHDHPQDIAALSARDLGQDARGFANLAIPLNALAGVANPGPTS
ncbi:MAG: 5'-nucleotidase C-terminal domain-containing protein, partial [Roseovarius sp.]